MPLLSFALPALPFGFPALDSVLPSLGLVLQGLALRCLVLSLVLPSLNLVLLPGLPFGFPTHPGTLNVVPKQCPLKMIRAPCGQPPLQNCFGIVFGWISVKDFDVWGLGSNQEFADSGTKPRSWETSAAHIAYFAQVFWKFFFGFELDINHGTEAAGWSRLSRGNST